MRSSNPSAPATVEALLGESGLGMSLPALVSSVPGPQSVAWVDRLAQHECPAITARRARRAAAQGLARVDPIVWSEARGCNILDVDGNRFVDLTAGFGVAALGHRAPPVVDALERQSRSLIHAMGDAFCNPGRILLLEQLAELTGLQHGILGSSGSDAVEAALKTARVATGRDRILSFDQGYHGLSYGALAVGGYRPEDFQRPFRAQLGDHSWRLGWGELPSSLEDTAGVLVEPVQGRGGMRTPPPGWLPELERICRRDGALLILDECYTGFGRTGSWFGFQREGLSPDLLCLGKALAGGFPISVCMGRGEIMERWGASAGEALHTQTFLGNPMGCAMALASLEAMQSLELAERAREQGAWLRERLARWGPVRGAGLMLGLELPGALDLSRKLLERGYIALPAGPSAEVLAVTPPLIISRSLLEGFLQTLGELLET